MIAQMNKETVEIVSTLANKLWPEADYNELYEDFREIIDKNDEICFLIYENKVPVGFIHASTRYDYVEGSQGSPVGYIEGVYVEEDHRRKGFSKSLVKEVEKWAKDKGYSELASDCELENEDSIAFHNGLDFTEANRIVCFIKEI